jgi:hypothetical protein
MKQILIILAVIITASQITSVNAQTTSPSSKNKRMTMHTRAGEGDTVGVFVNHIKADKRQQFEKFVHEIFWPMAKKLSPLDQHVFLTDPCFISHSGRSGWYL